VISSGNGDGAVVGSETESLRPKSALAFRLPPPTASAPFTVEASNAVPTVPVCAGGLLPSAAVVFTLTSCEPVSGSLRTAST
jgi:hypothetical protein